jgi:hypothetical protein
MFARFGSARLVLSSVFAGLLVVGSEASAQDRLVFTSGVALEGEIEELRRGNLDFDTDEMGLVEADWELVETISSSGQFEITTVSGAVYFGSLSGSGRRLTVVGPEGIEGLAFEEVVEILSISQGFFARTSGYLDVTANLARANSLFSLLAKGRAAYSGRSWALSVQGERYNQRQETADTAGQVFDQRTSRSLVNFTARRFFGGKFAATASQQIEQNEELSLEGRGLTTLGGEYNFIRNQSMELRFGAGAVLNSERYTAGDRVETGEIGVSGSFDAFDIGDLSLSTSVKSYTNPVDERFRVDIDGRISWEIFSDFFIGLNVVEKFDSAPPRGCAGSRLPVRLFRRLELELSVPRRVWCVPRVNATR